MYSDGNYDGLENKYFISGQRVKDILKKCGSKYTNLFWINPAILQNTLHTWYQITQEFSHPVGKSISNIDGLQDGLLQTLTWSPSKILYFCFMSRLTVLLMSSIYNFSRLVDNKQNVTMNSSNFTKHFKATLQYKSMCCNGPKTGHRANLQQGISEK